MKNRSLIYVVDSDPVNLRYMARMLKKSLRCKVRGFVDGQACLDRMKRKRSDIVICDFRKNQEFPLTMRSEAFLSTLTSKHPDVPVVVYSSVDDFEMDIKTMKLGAVEFIPRTEGFFERVVKVTKAQIEKVRNRAAERMFKVATISIIATISAVMLWLHYSNPNLLIVVSLTGLVMTGIALGIIHYYDTQELTNEGS